MFALFIYYLPNYQSIENLRKLRPLLFSLVIAYLMCPFNHIKINYTMKNFLFALIILSICACQPQKKEEARVVAKYTIEQFYKNKSIYGGQFSADESKLLVTSNETDIFNVYALAVDGSGMNQLTHSTEESFFGVTFFPEDDRFIFTHDKGGDENDHLYVQDTEGNVTDITPWDGSKSAFYGWARDLKSFFFVTNKRDPKFFDLYEMNIETFEPTLVYENNEGYEVEAISKDKKYLALVKPLTTSNSEMYLYNVETGEQKHISAHEGDATYSPQFFDVANKNLYFLTNEGSEFTYVVKYSLADSNKSEVWKTDWDVSYVYNSFNEKYRVTGVNEDAKTVVYMKDLETGEAVKLPTFESGNITSVSISRSETKVRLRVGTSTSPSDIYYYNLETKKLDRLTNTLNPEINEDDLVQATVVRYPSFDGVDIPAIFYKPHSASEENKVPALVWVHGGPGGQSRVGYFSLIQFLVNHDYAIIAVNNRGSSGYGKTFYKMDDKNHGEGDLQDCIKAKDYLASLGYIDMEKVGIIGGSYGGYMVMAALAFEPAAFDVGVNIFGVTNWLRTLKSIPPYWESARKALYEELGDPFTDDSVRLHKISPLFHAENVTKPLMVLQGANDPRVLQVESDEIVEKVKANGVPVEYVLFPDEGHGFVKKENEIKGYGQILTFLDAHLK